MSESNGHGPIHALIEVKQDQEAKVEARRSYEAESEKRRQKYQDELLTLQEARLKCMHQASIHAGNIGLVYHATTNNFSRVIIIDDLVNLTIERPEFTADLGLTSGAEEKTEEVQAHDSNENKPNPHEGEPIEPESTDAEALPPTPSFLLESAPLQGPLPAPEAPKPPQAPVLPEPPMPPSPPEIDKKWERNTHFKSSFAWFFSVFVGAFVGVGLMYLSLGEPKKDELWKFPAFVALGVAVIVTMKLLLDAMWYEAGRRRALGTATFWHTSYNVLVSLVVIAAENFLGAKALVKYAEKNTWSSASVPPLWQMLLVALAISTANLLLSAYVGYQKGQRSLTHEDLLKKRHELERAQFDEKTRRELERHDLELEAYMLEKQRYDEEIARLHEMRISQLDKEAEEIKRQDEIKALVHVHRLEAIEDKKTAHQEALQRWREQNEAIKSAQDAGITERSGRIDEFESYRKLPDFQALCKCIGIVETLNLRIDEFKRFIDNESISRGHARKNSIY
jgi:hypothetical protein